MAAGYGQSINETQIRGTIPDASGGSDYRRGYGDVLQLPEFWLVT